MPNGKIRLYNKLTNAQLVELDITGIFNIEDNLNDTPSNAKFKVVTDSTYREEFEVNTVIYHADTNTWWVIKSDESTYLHTGEYEHEIQVVEYLEWYAYKHLPNCAFAPNTYDLEEMLTRLFAIAKLNVQFVFPAFLDKDKTMPFMSFENFTVANAVKNIARAINAIPKAYVDISSGYQPKLTFVNRNGLDTAIVETLNTQFPTSYERNINSNDQFTTRSVSNIQNAKSSNLVVLPKQGGFKNITPNSLTYVEADAKVLLPSKIDKIEFMRIFPPMELVFVSSAGTILTTFASGYYLSRQEWYDLIVSTSFGGYSTAQKEDIADELPEPLEHFKVNYGETDISSIYDNINALVGANPKIRMFGKKMTIYNKFEFDTLNTTTYPDLKDRSVHWLPNTNQIIMPLSFRNGLEGTTDHNKIYRLYRDGITENEVWLRPTYRTTGFFANEIPNDKILIQVAYYPVADIKVSIDNDNNAQDEKYFNQNGKVIDALSVSRLITSHTNDSVEGTKIRNARYTSLASILALGQIVRDSNQLYVITQRSIDATIKDGNEYYNVVYTLSRNRIGRSENIVADSSVITYKIPDDNLVYRNQLYKDYIELSLTNITPKDTPYLPMSKALVFNGSLAGTDFDFTTIAEWRYKPTSITTEIVRHVANGSIFDLHKAKLFNINYQDNNVLGYRLDSTGATYVQTPIVYTNSVGKSSAYEFFLLDTDDLTDAIAHYNSTYTPDPIIPFTDLTQVPDNFYGNSVSTQGNYSVKITENTYDKDAFEIPVFEYMLQANDDYNANGNIIVGNDLFSTFTGTLRYHYIINNTTRFTPENANKLYTDNAPSSSTNKRVDITRVSATRLDLDLFSTYSGTRNTSAITNVGIYATDGTTVKFLFAINDYTMGDNDDITIYINNWKI
jgi:hypothetical protein